MRTLATPRLLPGVLLACALLSPLGCSGVDEHDNNNANQNTNTNDNSNQNNNNASGETGTLSGTLSASGSITCDASDTANDCQGTIFLVVMAENPITNPFQTPEAVKVLASSDLSGGQTLAYTIENLRVGSWYVSGFLDDDGNASMALPSPDLGDPIGYPAPQVTITAGQATTQNIAFSVRMP